MVRYATAGVGITPSSSTSAPTEQMPRPARSPAYPRIRGVLADQQLRLAAVCRLLRQRISRCRADLERQQCIKFRVRNTANAVCSKISTQMKHLTFLYDKGGEMIALQHLLSVRRFQIQMTVSLQRHASAARRRAAEKADLHEIRLVNIFKVIASSPMVAASVSSPTGPPP